MPLITQLHQKRCEAIEKAKREGKSEAEAKAQVDAVVSAPQTMSAGIIPSEHDRAALMASLDQDLERLSERRDVADKIQLKRDELLPKYLEHVDRYLASGARYANPLLVRCAVWSLDVEDMETTMRLADAAIEQQQNAPQNFKRDLPTYFAGNIADWAERQYKAKCSGSPYIDLVCERVDQNTWPTTNVIVRGNVFKTAGLLAEQNGEPKEALALFERAQEENSSAGCKTRITKLKEQLGVSPA